MSTIVRVFTMAASKTLCRLDLLPDELLVEILQRLPQDLVHRCKCVSKRWLNIISNNDFITSYVRYNTSLQNSKPPFALLYQYTNYGEERHCFAFSDNPLLELSLFSVKFFSPDPFSWPWNYVRLLFSYNGLVVCEGVSGLFCDYVCNPLTNQWVTVPKLLPHYSCSFWGLIGFIYKSTSSSCSFRIVHPCWNRNHQILNVYDLESKQWTESIVDEGFSFKDVHFSNRKAVVCNNLLHWKNDLGYIFVYDPFIARHNYNIIRLPNIGSNQHIESIIGVCKDHLRYFELSPVNYRLWELEEYDTGKWNLVIETRFYQFKYEGPIPLSRDLWPLCIHPFDEDILFLRGMDQIIWCNIRPKKMVHIHSTPHNGYFQFYPIALPWWPVSMS